MERTLVIRPASLIYLGMYVYMTQSYMCHIFEITAEIPVSMGIVKSEALVQNCFCVLFYFK